MSGEQLDPKEKLMIEAMVKEWGKELRSELAIIRQRSGGREKCRVRHYSRCNYFESNYDGYVDEKEEYIRPFVKPRSDSTSFVTPVWDVGGVVTKEEREDPKVTVLEEQHEEVEEIEAPSGPLTLFDDGDLDEQIEEYDGEQQEDVIHVDDQVSIVFLTPTQIYEDQVQLIKEAGKMESKDEKVEIKESGLMHKTLLDQSGDLEKSSTGGVWSAADHSDISPSFNFLLQEFDDVSSKGAIEDLIEFEELNFSPFGARDGPDLRTNPLQEEGNDAARRSWISLHGPRIEDDMG